jgi:sporulation protein YlmC with PRC-barrel domain
MTFFNRALALLALAFAPAAIAADATVPLSQLIDKSVVDARNNIIAQVKDLVVDVQENRAAFAVLNVGDFLNGYKQVMYPLPSGLGPIGATVAKVDSSKAALGNLDPVIEDPRYRLASQMAQAHVVDKDGKAVAIITDILVKADDGKLAGFVVEFDKSFYEGGGLVALPPSSLTAKDKDFVANFEAKDIRPAGKPGAPPPPDTSPDRDLRASEVIGMKVADPKGADIGEIRDLLATRDNRIAQVLIALPGGKIVAAPAPLTSSRFANGKFVLDAERVNGLPAQGPSDATLTPMSKLVRASVVDAKGDKVGGIADIVVNLGTGQVHYAVAEFNAPWIEKGKLVVLKVKNVRSTEKDGLVVGMALEDLKGTMFFDKAGWPDLNETGYRGYVDKYIAAH